MEILVAKPSHSYYPKTGIQPNFAIHNISHFVTYYELNCNTEARDYYEALAADHATTAK